MNDYYEEEQISEMRNYIIWVEYQLFLLQEKGYIKLADDDYPFDENNIRDYVEKNLKDFVPNKEKLKMVIYYHPQISKENVQAILNLILQEKKS